MFTFTSGDGLTVHVHAWVPDGPPRGVVQISHGMGEHALRYAPLAADLNARGYAVYANDHRGHGATMHAGPGVLGEDGWNLLVADVAALSRLLRERHTGLPLVLLGHSLGSFAAQQYLLDHPGLADGVALSGTTAVDLLLVDLARQGTDPLCGFALDAEGMDGLTAAAMGRLANPFGVPQDTPVYVLVGDRDPLNQGPAFSDQLVERYREAGVADLVYRVYNGARHELFNETDRDRDLVADLLDWIHRVTVRHPDPHGVR